MKSLEEMIAVMEASKTKEIEYNQLAGRALNHPEWRPFNPLVMRFNWVDFDYRVKTQEPRRVWVNEYQGSLSAFVHSLKCQANSSAEANRTNCVEFIELTPEIRERLGL